MSMVADLEEKKIMRARSGGALLQDRLKIKGNACADIWRQYRVPILHKSVGFFLLELDGLFPELENTQIK